MPDMRPKQLKDRTLANWLRTSHIKKKAKSQLETYYVTNMLTGSLRRNCDAPVTWSLWGWFFLIIFAQPSSGLSNSVLSRCWFYAACCWNDPLTSTCYECSLTPWPPVPSCNACEVLLWLTPHQHTQWKSAALHSPGSLCCCADCLMVEKHRAANASREMSRVEKIL